MTKIETYNNILSTLSGKANLKQVVYDNTLHAFETFKEVLEETTTKMNSDLGADEQRIHLAYSNSGEFTAQLKVAGDLLVFNMHSNIFQFDRNHEIWKTKYVQDNPEAGYSGIITIYNFLADSFKYSRMDDIGYLIARIFVNQENHFLVQGKRQSGFSYSAMGENKLDKKSIVKIVQAAIQYCLDFDLLVPPYDTVKLATVGQIHQSISDAKLRTGKRLGFQFRSDDID